MPNSATDTTSTTKVGRAAQVAAANAGLSYVDREYSHPSAREVRLKIETCGICHSDCFAFLGTFPGLKYPLVPGHELVGIVDAVGDSVTRLKVGDRVGVGWHGAHCLECESCRRGDFITCESLSTPGINIDGGYAEYGLFSEDACAKVPAEISSAEAGPLMCAGVTTFNALRNAGAVAGDTVAILGIGGLGHLGVQYANKMGFRTVAIARGKDKADFAKELGAHTYIDSQDDDAVAQLQKMGGAKVLLSTVTNAAAVSPWVEGLSLDGRLVVVGADVKPIEVSPLALISGRRSISGWPSGTARDSEDCMNFSALTGIRPMIEKFSFDKAEEAYNRMMSGKARFRVVLEIS